MPYQAMQQNLNQIAQICNQLSQNEQANVSRLNQMQQAERTAAQQLQQCAQLCNQVSQQMQQVISSQYSGAGQVSGFTGAGTGLGTSNWSNIPINTGQFGPTGQTGMGQFGGSGKFEASKGLGPTGQAAFNTNKDLNK